MKQTVKRSLMVSVMMSLLVIVLPCLAPPKLVLRFLPKDIYEAGKNHPAPSKKKADARAYPHTAILRVFYPLHEEKR